MPVDEVAKSDIHSSDPLQHDMKDCAGCDAHSVFKVIHRDIKNQLDQSNNYFLQGVSFCLMGVPAEK